jgi:hypothetical protein
VELSNPGSTGNEPHLTAYVTLPTTQDEVEKASHDTHVTFSPTLDDAAAYVFTSEYQTDFCQKWLLRAPFSTVIFLHFEVDFRVMQKSVEGAFSR